VRKERRSITAYSATRDKSSANISRCVHASSASCARRSVIQNPSRCTILWSGSSSTATSLGCQC